MIVLQFGYIFLTIISLWFIVKIGFLAIKLTSQNPIKDRVILLSSLLIWQLYIYVMCWTGVMKSYEFPPVFALLLILPLFAFTAIFLYSQRDKNWIKTIPQHWLVYFQSFRIFVEILFVFTVSKGVINYHVTIEGYNFDMIFGISAPLVGFLAYTNKKKILSKKAVLIWNYLGLVVLASVIFVFVTCIYVPSIYGSDIPLLPLKSMEYPYVLIAGFLMPAAVFLHVLSIVQITRSMSVENLSAT